MPWTQEDVAAWGPPRWDPGTAPAVGKAPDTGPASAVGKTPDVGPAPTVGPAPAEADGTVAQPADPGAPQAETTDQDDGVRAEDPLAWHLLLLNLAGSLPDGLLYRARSWLAAQEWTAVAQAVGFAAATGRVPLTAAEAALLSGRSQAAGLDADLIENLERIGDPAMRPVSWAFTAQLSAPVPPGNHPAPDSSAKPTGPSPEPLEDQGGPLDLSTRSQPPGDAVDQAIVAAAAQADLSAVWRAWRVPADGSPWPAARRVFVVQTDPDLSGADLIATTERLQQVLAAAGEVDPQVEVCDPGTVVPAYQSTACAHAALIWAGEEPGEVRVAAVFDAVDPHRGPVFAPEHPVIEDLDELTRLLAYLNNGLPVLTTSAMTTDVMDPDRRECVPLTFRTDGIWVWSEATGYFLERYGLAPEPALLEHLRGCDEQSTQVSDVTLHRILSHLLRADADGPVRTVPRAGA